MQKSTENAKKCIFCNFLKQTHLTLCTTKTYITFLPQNKSYWQRKTRDEKCKTNPISTNNRRKTSHEKMQNKPNLNHRATRPERRKYAKRTQFNQRETSDQRRETRICKTNPISPSRIEYQESCIENMQNKPNSSSTIERRETRDERQNNAKRTQFQTNPLVIPAKAGIHDAIRHMQYSVQKNAKQTQFQPSSDKRRLGHGSRFTGHESQFMQNKPNSLNH